MHHDRTWRSSESHHRYDAPYQRQKLKDVNWRTPAEAESISKEYNKWNKYWHRGRFNDRNEYNYKLEIGLIEKYIGKDYNEFLKAWHDRTQYLRNKGVVLEPWYIKAEMKELEDVNNWIKYYVDMDGIIRRNPKYHEHSKKKPIKIEEHVVVTYTLCDDIYDSATHIFYSKKFSGILWILRKYLSRNDYQTILEGNLDETSFRRLKKSAEFSGLNGALYNYCDRNNQEIPYKGWKVGYQYCHYTTFESLFRKDYSKSTYKYIYPGSSEYSRYMAEQQKATKKAHREYKYALDDFNSNLIRNIEAKRKAKDEMINQQKIDKHGFDDKTSFRGEEYHGQKRKKR